ncbi:MAG TPA: hypothetical protein VK203_04765 [Nostocaceae cyanobacterium]|nr:hypothetical protein [Nostocaceae cyanobacterium]
MKDNLSLIAAAAGGFMLSVALAGILKGAPVANLEKANFNGYSVANLQTVNLRKNELISNILEKKNE